MRNLVFSAREWNQLKELCVVLAPFSEATDLTEGERSVTISMVVPTVQQDGKDLNAVLAISQSSSAVSAEKILWNFYKSKPGQREWKILTF